MANAKECEYANHLLLCLLLSKT